MEKISRIKELESDDVAKFILFEKIDHGDIALMFNEFNFDKGKLDGGIRLYRNLGLVFKLTKQDPEALELWDDFISQTIPMPEEFNKLDNIFIGKDYKNILLVTNKRLMQHDLARLNQKINEINMKIEIHNAPLTKKPTIKDKIVNWLK